MAIKLGGLGANKHEVMMWCRFGASIGAQCESNSRRVAKEDEDKERYDEKYNMRNLMGGTGRNGYSFTTVVPYK